MNLQRIHLVTGMLTIKMYVFYKRIINIDKQIYVFLYRSVHPFKCPVILNITIGLIFDGNDCNFSATHIMWTLCKIVTG
jgi:hypothetical protein